MVEIGRFYFSFHKNHFLIIFTGKESKGFEKVNFCKDFQMSSENAKNNAQDLLGSYVKMKRLELNWTQEQLGINVGYAPQTAKQSISQLERGITWIPGKKLDEFINALSLDRSFFQLLQYHFSSSNYAESEKMLKRLNEYELKRMSRSIGYELEPLTPATPAPAPEPAPKKTVEDRLTRLKNVYDKGLIDEEDYKEAKREILRSLYE